MSLRLGTRRLFPSFVQTRLCSHSSFRPKSQSYHHSFPVPASPVYSIASSSPGGFVGHGQMTCVAPYPYLSLTSSSRSFHLTSFKAHGEYEWKDPEREEDVVMITVYNKEGKVDQVRGKVGDNLLYLCKRFDVDMEGACEASLACTTCHVYVDHEFLNRLPEASETEEDLLDAAPFLKENSRLGCQIILCKEYNGMVLRLPAATKNFYVDGHKPTSH